MRQRFVIYGGTLLRIAQYCIFRFDGWGLDGAPADGTSRVGAEPHVDALEMEAMEAARKKPGGVPVGELREAHGALHAVLEC